MAGNVKCDILNSSGVKETILNYNRIEYTPQLNGIGNFTINLGATGSYSFTKYVEYKADNGAALGNNEQGLVYFYKGSTLEFKGIVEQITYNNVGEMLLMGRGTGAFMFYDRVTNGSRNQEDADTRLGYIDNNSSKITFAGTLSAGNAEAKTYRDANIYDSMYDVVCLEMNDEFRFEFDGTVGNNDVLRVGDTIGTQSSVMTLTRGKDYSRLRRHLDITKLYNSVPVTGQYDGSNDQYFAATSTDATSQTTYGTRAPPYPVVDKSAATNTACSNRGDSIVSTYKDPMQNIIIMGVNPDLFTFDNSTHSVGDFITVNDDLGNLSGTSLRIVSYTRSIDRDRKESLMLNTIPSAFNFIKGAQVRSSANLTHRDGAAIDGSATLSEGDAEQHVQDDSLVGGKHTQDDSLGTANDGGSSEVVVSASGIYSESVDTSWTTLHSYSFTDACAYVFCELDARDTDIDITSPSSTGASVRIYDGSDAYATKTVNAGNGIFSFAGVYPKNPDNKTIYIQGRMASGTDTWTGGALIQGIAKHNHSVTGSVDGASDGGAVGDTLTVNGSVDGADNTGVVGDTLSVSGGSVTNGTLYVKGSID